MIFNKTNSRNLNYLRCELEANEIELFFCGATDPEHKLHWVSGEIVSLTDQIVEEAMKEFQKWCDTQKLAKWEYIVIVERIKELILVKKGNK